MPERLPSSPSERRFETLRTEFGLFPFEIPDEAVRALDEALEAPAAGRTDQQISRDALAAVLPFLRFSPTGDNHHNAARCPYCTPRERGAS